MSTLFYNVRHREVNGVSKNQFLDKNLDRDPLFVSRDLYPGVNNKSQMQNSNEKGLKQTGNLIFPMKSGRGMLAGVRSRNHND